MVQNLENYRQQVSGVSLDEEMVNLVKFQHAYNAAAKLITTADEMMDEILALAN
jgi:flagellar hook-associated protein 1 FlgK